MEGASLSARTKEDQEVDLHWFLDISLPSHKIHYHSQFKLVLICLSVLKGVHLASGLPRIWQAGGAGALSTT